MPDSLCKDAFRRSPSAILQPGYLLPSHLPRLHHLRHAPPLFLRCIPPGLPQDLSVLHMLFRSYHPDPVSKQRFLYPVSFHRVPAAVHYIFPDSPGCPSHPPDILSGFRSPFFQYHPLQPGGWIFLNQQSSFSALHSSDIISKIKTANSNHNKKNDCKNSFSGFFLFHLPSSLP